MCEKEERVEHVVQKIDKINEAKGHAISILNELRRQQMTEEERKRQAKEDNDALFGPDRE